jgi:biopolymer transport protein ExbD
VNLPPAAVDHGQVVQVMDQIRKVEGVEMAIAAQKKS